MAVALRCPILRRLQAILDGREHGVTLAQVGSLLNGCYELQVVMD